MEKGQRYKLEGSLKISHPEKLKGQNITIRIEYEVPEYVCTGADISKIAIRNADEGIKKMVKYGLFAAAEMRLSGLL